MNDDTKTAVAKITATSALAAFSHMSMVEVVQLVAAIVAIVYGSLQIYVLIRDKFKGDRHEEF